MSCEQAGQVTELGSMVLGQPEGEGHRLEHSTDWDDDDAIQSQVEVVHTTTTSISSIKQKKCKVTPISLVALILAIALVAGILYLG